MINLRRAIRGAGAILPVLMLIAGCSGNQGGGSFDARSGFVSKSYQADAGALTPNAIRLDSKYRNYYIYDHLVFLGQQDSTRYALTVTFGRGLADNKFVRAERDFAGFLFAGQSWVTLPYTRMKHDSTRLDLSYPCVFGGLRWTEPYTAGLVTYDRHDIKFELKFSGLRPVQSLREGEGKLRSHAIGEATLTLPTGTVSGKVFYELAQLEGYNSLVNVNTGIDFTNYDWIACSSTSGENLLCSVDTATESNRLIKNFVAVSGADGLRYAEGADHVRIASDMIQRDHNIYDYLALRKNLTISDLGVDLKLNLTDSRIFYTTGYCLAIVEGDITLDNRSERIWGVLEHRQKPKANTEQLQ